MEYGKVRNGTIEYAPSVVQANGLVVANPLPQLLEELGYLPVDEGSPEEDDVLQRWEERDGKCVAVYCKTEKHNTYSKARLARALIEAGMYTRFAAAASRNNVLGFVWESFSEFDDNDPMWETLSSAAKNEIGASDEIWQGILDRAKV